MGDGIGSDVQRANPGLGVGNPVCFLAGALVSEIWDKKT